MEPYALMVQTDDDDRFFADSTMREIDMGVNVEYVSNIDQLANLTEKKGEPHVILINDSSIRPAGGQLKKIKADKNLSHIPVVILGEVATDEYIKKYYSLGANSYVIKPSTIEGTKKKIETFFRYWFEVAD
jgi:response regulator RpfG family c-di-GMP phosphodiesterase